MHEAALKAQAKKMNVESLRYLKLKINLKDQYLINQP